MASHKVWKGKALRRGAHVSHVLCDETSTIRRTAVAMNALTSGQLRTSDEVWSTVKGSSDHLVGGEVKIQTGVNTVGRIGTTPLTTTLKGREDSGAS